MPKSDIPGEVTSPTQPLSSLSTGFRTLTADDIWGATPEDLAECRARFATLRYDGPFTPPSERGSVQVPANIGGAHWGGVAYDSERGIAIVPNNRLAAVVKLIPRETWKVMREKLTSGERVGKEFTDMQGTPYVMQREIWLSSRRSPCTAPPFGTLTAISLKTGKTLWDVPLGTSEGLDKIGIPSLPADTGMANLGGAITTAGGIVFIGATLDAYVRAFDVETGKELWKYKLPAGGKATPATYLGADGRQYLVISAGGDGKSWGKADSSWRSLFRSLRRRRIVSTDSVDPGGLGMAQTFDIRFARSAGLAAMLEVPENAFRWKGGGLLRIDAQGISIGLKRGLLALLGGKRTQRIPTENLRAVYREGDALRVEYQTGKSARVVLPFWADDREPPRRSCGCCPPARRSRSNTAPGPARKAARRLAHVVVVGRRAGGDRGGNAGRSISDRIRRRATPLASAGDRRREPRRIPVQCRCLTRPRHWWNRRASPLRRGPPPAVVPGAAPQVPVRTRRHPTSSSRQPSSSSTARIVRPFAA